MGSWLDTTIHWRHQELMTPRWEGGALLVEQCLTSAPQPSLQKSGDPGRVFLDKMLYQKTLGAPQKSPCTLRGCGLLVYDPEHVCLCGCRPRSPAPRAMLPLHGQRQPSPMKWGDGQDAGPHKWNRSQMPPQRGASLTPESSGTILPLLRPVPRLSPPCPCPCHLSSWRGRRTTMK